MREKRIKVSPPVQAAYQESLALELAIKVLTSRLYEAARKAHDLLAAEVGESVMAEMEAGYGRYQDETGEILYLTREEDCG